VAVVLPHPLVVLRLVTGAENAYSAFEAGAPRAEVELSDARHGAVLELSDARHGPEVELSDARATGPGWSASGWRPTGPRWSCPTRAPRPELERSEVELSTRAPRGRGGAVRRARHRAELELSDAHQQPELERSQVRPRGRGRSPLTR
jgi:hypothetical protein